MVEPEINRENTVMSDQAEQPLPERNGRDGRGLFQPGNQIAKGNVGNARMKALRRVLLDCATPEKVKEVEASLYGLAVGGDTTAIRIWLDHVVGRPVQSVSLSAPEGVTLDLRRVVATIMLAIGDDEATQVRVGQALKQLELMVGEKALPAPSEE
jgi:hypothetical protein